MKYLVISIIVILIISIYSYTSYQINENSSYLASNSYIFRLCNFDIKNKKFKIIVTPCRSEQYDEKCYYSIEGKKQFEFELFKFENDFYIAPKFNKTTKPIKIFRCIGKKILIPYDELSKATIGQTYSNQKYLTLKYTKYF